MSHIPEAHPPQEEDRERKKIERRREKMEREEDSIFIEIPKPKAKKTVNVEIQDLNSPRPNSYQSKLPYPERMKVRKNDKPSAQHSRFLKMFKQLHLEIVLKDALVEMPKFNKCGPSTTITSDDPSPSSSSVKTSDNLKKFTDELTPLNSLPSGDDVSILKRDSQEGNFQVHSNPLFEFDDNFKSSIINPLFYKMEEDVEIKNSNIYNDLVLRQTPLSDKGECFDLGDENFYTVVCVSTNLDWIDGCNILKQCSNMISIDAWKRISDKRTKNQAKTDKTEHGMEKRGKAKCMRTRSQSRNLNRQQQQAPPAFVEPFNLEEPIENPAPPVVPMADNRTMAQLLQAPTEGYEDAIVIPEINANFELKHGLINLVQNKQFFGHDKEDPHAHIRYFNKITSTMRFPDIPSTSIKLMLFPFSLEGSARIWLEKEPPRSILTWDDLVSKFINQFFPPSKTTNLRNEITRFQQRFDESFYEAWDQFNDLLRACPHHGFSELHQLDTFYNALNANDQDSLNSAAGGNFLDKMPRECLKIIENVAALTTEVSELKNMMKTMLVEKQKAQAPAPVKAVEQSCVTCGGAHSYRNCPATDGNIYQDNIQEYVSQAAAANFNQGNTNSRPPMEKSLSSRTNPDLHDARTYFSDFVVVDFEPDSRVPLSLGRSFLKTSRALIDVYKGEITLCVGKEAITFNLDQTSRYTANYNHMTANRIDVIDMACEEYSQEGLGFSNVISSGNPTPYYDPIISTSSPTLNPFGDSDFLLFEETDSFLAIEDDPTSPEVDPTYYDPDGDIFLLEAILNSDPSPPLPNQGNYFPEIPKDLKICEANNEKSSVNKPPEVELKDLPPHLEYSFLEGNDKLPFIIAKDLKNEEKATLIEVLKSHKRAFTWKLSDIKGIDSEFCTHKILMEED
ncbi:reverse transcriptase domain-containing protein [Tanacetum coccineum]